MNSSSSDTSDNLGHHSDNPHNVFDNPELFIEKFDGSDRDEWQKPDAVIKALGLKPDSVVAEIGAGTGYFTVRLAEHVTDGKIFAFEHAPKMADYLKNRVNELGLYNVDVRTTNPDGSLVLENPADLIFSVDVYHHIPSRVEYFANVLKYLNDNGSVVIIDRTDEKVEGQPHGHRVPASAVKEEMRAAGFQLFQELDFLLPVQYYLAFKRAAK